MENGATTIIDEIGQLLELRLHAAEPASYGDGGPSPLEFLDMQIEHLMKKLEWAPATQNQGSRLRDIEIYS